MHKSFILLDRSKRQYFVLIDEEDWDLVSQYTWTLHRSGKYVYCRRWVRVNGKIKWVFLHNELMNTPKGKIVDHINHNGLDNRRSNLRICTYSQNLYNSKKYDRVLACNNWLPRGVTEIKTKTNVHYKVQISVKGNSLYLGCYNDPDVAGEVYKIAALKYHKQFCNV